MYYRLSAVRRVESEQRLASMIAAEIAAHLLPGLSHIAKGGSYQRAMPDG
jgi:hypothetical protein